MKPGQRKVLFTCMKRNDKREVKVAQLAGSVAEMSAYHHGEVQSPFQVCNMHSDLGNKRFWSKVPSFVCYPIEVLRVLM